jgi:predicted molibdopterin-dependent oxidoreductase YjgC
MSNHINITINGQPIAVAAGSTILEAAESIGVFIPTLCHQPELTSQASCRICVVEIEGQKNLAVSCTTKVKEGMVIYSESAAVVEARKTIIELLLANHPKDCLTCGKAGDCRLQDYAFMYGIRDSSFTGEQHNYPIEADNPFIVRDLNKCIMCGKCVRACSEVQGKSVLDFAFRGIDTKITTAMDTPLRESECVFCGNCVAVCPVGALQEKGLRSQARTWEIKKVKTTCPYCGVGCNFDLNVKNGKVVGVTSCDGAVNGWALCVKGRFGYHFIHHPDRLTSPLIKKDGQFVPASWDEAIELVTNRLMSLKQNHGADALAVLSSARCTNEENYLLQKFTRAVLGTNNIDHCARL